MRAKSRSTGLRKGSKQIYTSYISSCICIRTSSSIIISKIKQASMLATQIKLGLEHGWGRSKRHLMQKGTAQYKILLGHFQVILTKGIQIKFSRHWLDVAASSVVVCRNATKRRQQRRKLIGRRPARRGPCDGLDPTGSSNRRGCNHTTRGYSLSSKNLKRASLPLLCNGVLQ